MSPSGRVAGVIVGKAKELEKRKSLRSGLRVRLPEPALRRVPVPRGAAPVADAPARVRVSHQN